MFDAMFNMMFILFFVVFIIVAVTIAMGAVRSFKNQKGNAENQKHFEREEWTETEQKNENRPELRCPYCGAPIHKDDKVCEYCGVRL